MYVHPFFKYYFELNSYLAMYYTFNQVKYRIQ